MWVCLGLYFPRIIYFPLRRYEKLGWFKRQFIHCDSRNPWFVCSPKTFRKLSSPPISSGMISVYFITRLFLWRRLHAVECVDGRRNDTKREPLAIPGSCSTATRMLRCQSVEIITVGPHSTLDLRSHLDTTQALLPFVRSRVASAVAGFDSEG